MTSTTSSNGRATNGRAIHVEQAEVRTATVTISALKIDNRQVTQSVFKQLIEEPVVDPGTGQFRGLPWGTVNYCPSNCHGGRNSRRYHHLHVVWQEGDELRRAAECEPEPFRPWVEEPAKRWLILALAEGWRPGPRHRGVDGFNVRFVDGLPDVLCIPPQVDREAIRLFCKHGYDENYHTDAGRDALAEQAQAVRDELHVSTSAEMPDR